MTIRTPSTGWTNGLYAFTTKTNARSVCLKFGMMFGGGNQANPADRFYLDDDRGTTNTLSSSLNPAAYGQPVTFIATVSPANPAIGTPTGTVQFKTNGMNFGSVVSLSGGCATSDVLPATLPPGIYTVTADYGGDANFTRSTGTLTGGQIIYSQPEPRIITGWPAGNNIVIEWPGTASWLYSVQYSPSLCPAAWSNLPACTDMTGWNGIMSATNDTGVGDKMFYRIQMTR